MLEIIKKILIAVVGLLTVLTLALLYMLVPNLAWTYLGIGLMALGTGFVLALSCYFVGMCVLEGIELGKILKRDGL